VTSPQSEVPRARVSASALGIGLVLISAAAFGSGALLVQPLYEAGMDALAVLSWRFLTAAVLSWAYLLARRRTRLALGSLPRRRVVVLLVLGALYVGNSYAYFAALQTVPITLTSIISYLYPAIVAVMALRFIRRLEGRRAWLALCLSMLGVALAVGGIPEGEVPPLGGLVLAFANPLIYATWIVLQARLAGDRPAPATDSPIESSGPDVLMPPGDAETVSDVPDPAVAAAVMTSATAAVYVVLAVGADVPVSPADIPDQAWLPLLALGLVATAIAIQTFYAGVKRVGAARASLISTVEPVYTIVLAVLLFGEHLTPVQVTGGMLVILAVILAETGRPRGPTPRAARRATDAAPPTSGVPIDRRTVLDRTQAWPECPPSATWNLWRSG